MLDLLEAYEIDHNIATIYGRAELELIKIIRDTLAKQPQDETIWATNQLLAIRHEQHKITRVIGQLNHIAPELFEEITRAAYQAGIDQALTELEAIPPASGFSFTAAPGSTPINDAAVHTLAQQAVVTVHEASRSILRTTDDAWRKIVYKATGYSTTGTLTTYEAAQRSFTTMARDGMGFFVDRSGRQWSLDSYAEMATRTATTRALQQGHTDTLTANGVDLVVVSSHPRPAPVCAPYERKVLSLTGKFAPGRHQINEHSFTVTATLDDARDNGLGHPNCRHRWSAYVPGYTDLTPPKPDPGNEGYEATQHQRYLERQVRASKRMEAAALTDADRAKARARGRAYQARIREHVKAHNLPRYRHREQLRTPGKKTM